MISEMIVIRIINADTTKAIFLLCDKVDIDIWFYELHACILI